MADFILMYGRNQHNIVIMLELKVLKKKPKYICTYVHMRKTNKGT